MLNYFFMLHDYVFFSSHYSSTVLLIVSYIFLFKSSYLFIHVNYFKIICLLNFYCYYYYYFRTRYIESIQ